MRDEERRDAEMLCDKTYRYDEKTRMLALIALELEEIKLVLMEK
jgi:hypothetical protein